MTVLELVLLFNLIFLFKLFVLDIKKVHPLSSKTSFKYIIMSDRKHSYISYKYSPRKFHFIYIN